MPDINIDTTDANYQTWLSRFRTLRDSMKPRVKMYGRLTKDQQQEWLSRDPMMAEFMEMCEKVAIKTDDG